MGFFRCICVLFPHGTTPYAQTEYHLNVKKKTTENKGKFVPPVIR